MAKWMWVGVAGGALYLIGIILLVAIRRTGPEKLGWFRWLSMIWGTILLAIFLEDLLKINMFIIGAVLLVLTGMIMGALTSAGERAYMERTGGK